MEGKGGAALDPNVDADKGLMREQRCRCNADFSKHTKASDNA